MLGGMGYTDKLQRLCALRGMDQSALASKVNLSKSSISRILSGTQEPKLRLAYDLAKALGVTLDYLVDDSPEIGPTDQLVMLSDDEVAILKIVRRLGTDVAFDRLLQPSTRTRRRTSRRPGARPIRRSGPTATPRGSATGGRSLDPGGRSRGPILASGRRLRSWALPF